MIKLSADRDDTGKHFWVTSMGINLKGVWVNDVQVDGRKLRLRVGDTLSIERPPSGHSAGTEGTVPVIGRFVFVLSDVSAPAPAAMDDDDDDASNDGADVEAAIAAGKMIDNFRNEFKGSPKKGSYFSKNWASLPLPAVISNMRSIIIDRFQGTTTLDVLLALCCRRCWNSARRTVTASSRTPSPPTRSSPAG
jgi:hypothetical protein